MVLIANLSNYLEVLNKYTSWTKSQLCADMEYKNTDSDICDHVIIPLQMPKFLTENLIPV